MRTFQECTEFVAELESRFPVNDWAFENTKIWPFIRTVLFYRLSLSLRGLETRVTAFERLKSRLKRSHVLFDCFTAPFRDPRQNAPQFDPAEVFVLTYAGARQARLNGQHFDIRSGPLIEELRRCRIRSLVWEFSNPLSYRLPRSNPTYLVQRDLFLSQIGQLLSPRSLRNANLLGYREFCDHLRARKEFYSDLDASSLARSFGDILTLRDRFERALERIDPALVLTSNVGRYEFALHLACHRRGIPSIELQHGVQGPIHGQYAQWTRVPAEGYDLLPYGYWSWDPESAEAINSWSAGCAPRHHARVGGIPWLDYSRTIRLEEFPPPLVSALREDEGRRRVLVTLQPPDKIYTDARQLPNFVLEAMARMDRSWIWWIRFHPAMAPDRTALNKELGRHGISAEFEVANELPLYTLLQRADLHITHSSSAVLDADHFGVRSVVWSKLGADLFPASIRSGSCVLALDEPELSGAMSRMMSAGRQERPAHSAPYPSTLQALIDLGRQMRSAARQGLAPSLKGSNDAG